VGIKQYLKNFQVARRIRGSQPNLLQQWRNKTEAEREKIIQRIASRPELVKICPNLGFYLTELDKLIEKNKIENEVTPLVIEELLDKKIIPTLSSFEGFFDKNRWNESPPGLYFQLDRRASYDGMMMPRWSLPAVTPPIKIWINTDDRSSKDEFIEEVSSIYTHELGHIKSVVLEDVAGYRPADDSIYTYLFTRELSAQEERLPDHRYLTLEGTDINFANFFKTGTGLGYFKSLMEQGQKAFADNHFAMFISEILNDRMLCRLLGESYVQKRLPGSEKMFNVLEKEITNLGEEIDYYYIGLPKLSGIVKHMVKLSGFLTESISPALRERIQGLLERYNGLVLDLIKKIKPPSPNYKKEEFQSALQTELPSLLRAFADLWTRINFRPEYRDKKFGG
jgi:hypothetical protein